jgi:cytidine deaminase
LTDEDLVVLAQKARINSYSPYSHYSVGAALLAASGRVYTGCNVENASYGLTVCAERVAVWKGVSEGEKEFTAVAIASDNSASPCGACRQVLAEFAGGIDGLQRFRVLLVNPRGDRQSFTLAELLPVAFSAAKLRRV